MGSGTRDAADGEPTRGAAAEADFSVAGDFAVAQQFPLRAGLTGAVHRDERGDTETFYLAEMGEARATALIVKVNEIRSDLF
jgi:hypothetical protein